MDEIHKLVVLVVEVWNQSTQTQMDAYNLQLYDCDFKDELGRI